jgi:clan AA aspartic protease
MSIVRTDITLKNAVDVANAETGLVKDSDIRQTTVKALVDTGAWTLVINEAIREELGLRTVRKDYGTLADGTQSVYNMAGPVEIHWKNRWATCEALVLPEAREILLGAIPLEAMDLMVHPLKEEVVGAHGDQIMHLIM